MKELTDSQLLTRGWEIIDKFEEESAGDPFGWDWPTMALLFPELYQEFLELKTEWNLRHPKES